MAKLFTDEFMPLNIAILTVSDSRDAASDSSGDFLVASAQEAGHQVLEKTIVIDDVYKIREILSRWIADTATQVVIITGGTGYTERDSTPEAVIPLFDKTIEGFGELFRHISIRTIGSSTVQSRAVAGLANDVLIFCIPGSTNACRQAWDEIICSQLDSRHKPCNFALRVKKIKADV
ncbi:MAG: molybdenum cofactor biosynthesis protein B [Oleibacter sp.]|nr:molybdenum cofactor biosynthesis protein B [Thalassolituus sp.]